MALNNIIEENKEKAALFSSFCFVYIAYKKFFKIVFLPMEKIRRLCYNIHIKYYDAKIIVIIMFCELKKFYIHRRIV